MLIVFFDVRVKNSFIPRVLIKHCGFHPVNCSLACNNMRFLSTKTAAKYYLCGVS